MRFTCFWSAPWTVSFLRRRRRRPEPVTRNRLAAAFLVFIFGMAVLVRFDEAASRRVSSPGNAGPALWPSAGQLSRIPWGCESDMQVVVNPCADVDPLVNRLRRNGDRLGAAVAVHRRALAASEELADGDSDEGTR